MRGKKTLKTQIIPLLFLLIITSFPVKTHSIGLNGKDGLISYLKWSFVSELNLCFDAPNIAPKQIWVLDNKVAYFSLLSYDTYFALKIKNQLQNISLTYNIPHDNDSLPITFKHDPVFGIQLPQNGFNYSIQYSLYNQSGYEIKQDIANSTDPMPNWDDYADLCIYYGLNEYLKGNIANAKYYIDRVIAMWDGYGIADKIYRDNFHYETYKLALLYMAKNILGYGALSFENKLIETVWRQQNITTGGIHTHYMREGNKLWSEELYSDTNIETTAFVLLSNMPYYATEKAWYEDPKRFGLIMVLVVICIFIFKLAWDKL